MILLQVITRLLAIVGKELVEMVRRPGALLSMVLGPFLIMGLFGLGYDSSISSFQAELIGVPASSGLSTNPADYQAFVPPGDHLQSVGTDAAAAEAALCETRRSMLWSSSRPALHRPSRMGSSRRFGSNTTSSTQPRRTTQRFLPSNSPTD